MRRLSSSAAALAAAACLCLPLAGHAEEVHTITPHFPDNFKLRYTSINDSVQESQGQTEKEHTSMAATGTVTRQGNGYHGSYRIDSYELSSDSAAGEEKGQRMILDAMKGLTAEITLDNNLDPVTVDNIEDIKAVMKDRLTKAPDPNEAKAGLIVYNLLLGNQTPQSAAGFVRQSRQAGNFYNVPLTMNVPVRVDTAPLEVMGGSLRTNSHVILTGWEEGKVAHLHFTMAPTDEDLRGFMGGIMRSMFGQLLQGQQNASEVQTMLDRMVANMEMTIGVDCDVDVNLVTYVENHQVCDTRTFVKMDMKKIMPPELLKQDPTAADKLPVITMTQSAHMINDTVLVP